MKEPNFEFSRDRGGFSKNGFTVSPEEREK